jgi:glycosyltransferase involved in cell wall biosynthesis
MRILFLSRWFPWPPANGSKLRIYNLLRGLAQQHEVTLLSFVDQPSADPLAPELHSLCQDVRLVLWKVFKPDRLIAQFRLLGRTPRSIADTFSSEMAENIQEILSARNYDLVIASQLGTACYSQYFRGTPALFEEAEVGLLFDTLTNSRSLWRRIRLDLMWAKHRHYLARLLSDFQACTVVSERERQLLSREVLNHDSIEIIPNFINLADYEIAKSNPQPNFLIFTGSFRYAVNHDAMVWFLQEVYPRVQTRVPEVRLAITGDNDNLPLPPARNVTLTGRVRDVRPLIASAWASLVPIRVGGGTRMKILESMALGTPIVSTSKGAEGLEVCHGQELLIADTAQEFADSVVRLLKDPELRRGMVDHAYQLVSQKYDQAVILPRFLNLAEAVASV